jgi:predicted nucleotidyltransferase
MPLNQDVERFVTELVRRFEPERVVLFGWHAPGSPQLHAEVGLLVVMPFEGRPLAQAVRIEQEVEHDFPLEVLVRRPEEVEQAIEMGNSLIEGILKRGRSLYVRPGEPAAKRRGREAPQEQRPRGTGKVNEDTLREITQRIVAAVAPERIILFGSAARGEMGPDSDVDLMVIKACADRRETARTIRRSLWGVAPGLPKDIVVVTPEDIDRDRDTIGYIIRPALREGRTMYAA